MKETYKVVTYDVWGNEQDGWEVNDVHYTGETVTLSDTLSDKGIITSLKKQGIIKKTVKNHCIEIDGEFDFALYFSYKGRPEIELRRETSAHADPNHTA